MKNISFVSSNKGTQNFLQTVFGYNIPFTNYIIALEGVEREFQRDSRRGKTGAIYQRCNEWRKHNVTEEELRASYLWLC